MRQHVAFAYSIGDEAMVKHIGMIGVIDQLIVCQQGLQYGVHYWNDGDRFYHTLYEWELEEVSKSDEVNRE